MGLARETYLDALAAATFAGRLALGGGMREVAEAALAAPQPPGPLRGPDLLLDGLALLICQGYPAGAPVLRRAVSAFRGTDVSREEGLRWLWLACHAACLCGTTPAGTCCPAAGPRPARARPPLRGFIPSVCVPKTPVHVMRPGDIR